MIEIEKPQLYLFEAFGIELEYIIVDKDTLDIKPIADVLLKKITGEFVNEVERGEISWSNELVNHVVELKTNGPAKNLEGLGSLFHKNVIEVNKQLEEFNAVLMPGGAHPWMNPFKETQIWKHDYNAIYSLYNRIFDCRGHGWSNLQSTHINLPFHGDEEFGRLHAAIRVLLPIIPALSASSPILDSKDTGFLDARLETYRHNQDKLPSIAGKVIPEKAFSKAAYYEKIFLPIMAEIKPYDHENILEHHFLNSRGAIARFDRNAIEIRIIDIQECPSSDLAIASVVIDVLKQLVNETWCSYEDQKKWDEDMLAEIWLKVIKYAETTLIENVEYISLFGVKEKLSAQNLWKAIIEKSGIENPYAKYLNLILSKGSLSSRILKLASGDFSSKNLYRIYSRLIECLAKNQCLE